MDTSSSDLAQFVGRFHALLVHLPIGFIILLAVFEMLLLSPRYATLNTATGVIVWLTLPAVGLSILCGYLLAQSGGYDARLVGLHRNGAYLLGVGCVVLAVLHGRGWYRAYRVGLLFVLGLLCYTSHLGGSLTHGSDYLIEFAPKPIKSLFPTKRAATPPGPSDQEKSFYLATLQPAFDRYCVACHGPEKAKGKLRLDSFEALMQGGSSGPSIVAGDPAKSDLLNRMVSSPEADDHMPPAGKPQPPPELNEVLRWWIEVGAPGKEALSQLNPPETLRNLLPKVAGSTPSP